MPRTLSGALWCVVLASACRSSAQDPSRSPEVSIEVRGQEGPARAQITPEGLLAARAEAIHAIEQGDLSRARALLDGLLLDEHLERARELLVSAAPEDALIAVDEALRLAPYSLEARLLKADASLRLAEAKIADGGGSAGLIEGALGDALEYYRSAGESAHALFGASRAAWLLGQREQALDYARRGLALREGDEAGLSALGLAPERIHAEQVFAAYAGARRAESEQAAALFLESEEALARVLGRSSDDPWAWARLADLYEWEGRLAEAKGALERGLRRASADADLLERLARVTRNLEGSAASVRTFEAYVRAHPRVLAGQWQLAVARFALALEGLLATPRTLAPAAFTAVEAEFRALRERAAEFTQGALGYEVVCRLARGWCAFHAGELAQARTEFLSMNALFEGGIEWALPGQLESGIQGLFFVADAFNAREDKLAAGETFETLHGLQPQSYLWANNAGFFLRDAAFDLEREGRRLCRAARGEVTNNEELLELRALAGLAPAGSAQERDAFRRAADERFARARPIMERSWQAYRPAAELAPEDIRVVNDAALVLVYYLHHDLELAEKLLLRCVELGGPQVAAKQAELAVEASPERAQALESELALLTEAWGDAHQNLGVLAWVHRKDGAAARPWLEKALEIWPERAPVRNSLLPQVRGERAPERDDPWDLLNWAQPCR